jgi:hypothetical protein
MLFFGKMRVKGADKCDVGPVLSAGGGTAGLQADYDEAADFFDVSCGRCTVSRILWGMRLQGY